MRWALIAVIAAGLGAMQPAQSAPKQSAPIWAFTMRNIDGKLVKLSRFRGKVLLIVNTASHCGNTPQYSALEELYVKYKSRGLVVLGFPANDFNSQEPGTNQEIKEFCTSTYHVTFPMFSKIVVKGDGQAPLYSYLTSKETDPQFGGDIDWNFAKFIINRKGEIVGRFPAKLKPNSPEVIAAIESQLKPERQASQEQLIRKLGAEDTDRVDW